MAMSQHFSTIQILSHHLKTKTFDDISAIIIVDVGVSHKVACVRVCVQLTVWRCMCGYVSLLLEATGW